MEYLLGQGRRSRRRFAPRDDGGGIDAGARGFFAQNDAIWSGRRSRRRFAPRDDGDGIDASLRGAFWLPNGTYKIAYWFYLGIFVESETEIG